MVHFKKWVSQVRFRSNFFHDLRHAPEQSDTKKGLLWKKAGLIIFLSISTRLLYLKGQRFCLSLTYGNSHIICMLTDHLLVP